MHTDSFKQFLKDQLDLLGRLDVEMLELDQLNIGLDATHSLVIQMASRRKCLAKYLLSVYRQDHPTATQPKSLEFVEQSSFDPPDVWSEFRDLRVVIEWGTPDGDQSRFYVQVPESVGISLRLPRCMRQAKTA